MFAPLPFSLRLGIALPLLGASLAIAQVPILWSDATSDHRWENALNWAPPIVPNGTQFDVQIGPQQTVSCELQSQVIVQSVSVSQGQLLNLHPNASLTIDGAAPALTNDGAISLVAFSAGSPARLRFNRSTRLEGSGQILLAGEGPGTATITAGSTTEPVAITNDTGHRIHGEGDVDMRDITFRNNGVISADRVGPLRLLLSASLDQTTVNNGTIEGNGGDLRIETGTLVDQSGGGVIQAVWPGNGAGSVHLGQPGFPAIRGGIVRSLPGARVTVNSATFDNCELGGLIEVLPRSGSTLAIAPGVLTNNSTVVVNPAGAAAFTQVSFLGAVQLAGHGSFQLNGSGLFDAFLSSSGSTVTNAASHVLRGRGTLAIPLINNGLVSADVTGAILRGSTSWQNNGVMEAKNGGILDLTGSGFAAQSRAGTLIAQDSGSVIRIGIQSSTPGPELFAADLKSVGSGRILIGRATLRDSHNAGLVDTLVPGPLTVKGQLTNDGLIMPQAQLVMLDQSSLAGSGAVHLARGAIVLNAVGGSSTVATNASGHTIAGNGGINTFGSGAVFINNGTIAPGSTAPSQIGVITSVGNITLGASSRLAFEINGTAQGVTYDVLRKNDAVPLQLGGELHVTLTKGFSPAPNDTFSVLSTGTNLVGSFSNVQNGGRLTTDDGRGSFRVAYDASDVLLSEFQAMGSGTPTPTPSATPTPSPAPRALNISTRMQVRTGERVLIGGFIISGVQSKTVLLRGVGPSLTTAGITGALEDPLLELHTAAGHTIAVNNNWKDTQEAAITATGIPPSDDREPAILQTLAPGNYTAIERGVGDTTGIALVEIYDVGGELSSRLANISTRGFVESGDRVMIGGFILGGGNAQTAATVLIRALGPSLSTAGVAGALADPVLELHDSNGVTLARNDNWKDEQPNEIEATTIPPPNDAESAIFATLSAGHYTVIVSGKSDATGIGLIEIYNLQ